MSHPLFGLNNKHEVRVSVHFGEYTALIVIVPWTA